MNKYRVCGVYSPEPRSEVYCLGWILKIGLLALNWQLPQAAKRTWTQSWSALVKAMTFLSSFSQWEFSVSGETGNPLFPKMSTAPLFISAPTLYPFETSFLRWHPVLSRFCSLRTFNYRIKIRENGREGCEQSLLIVPHKMFAGCSWVEELTFT